ncbi:hypothetical protein BKA70DRAFT_677636 [Coprinopsis sp. MPI-PUGE-AT-0042]|nr:hypothetical protein BKA70DRAFT_677636 [Coprinopsis sp. MPI-PUGE-AT-0042]
MHQIFENQELVRLIIDAYHEVTAKRVLAQRRKSFLGLALLSKTFFEAAADHLWTDVESLGVFTDLLPTEQLKNLDGTFYLCGPVTPSTLERWHLYSHRTRSITIGTTNSRVLSQVHAVLLEHQTRTNEPLFPNLHQIVVDGTLDTDDLIPLSILTASPSLHGAKYTEGLQAHPVELITASMMQLAHRAPQLKEWSLKARRSTVPASIIPTLPHLSSVKLDLVYHPQHLAYIGTFGSLPNFSMDLHAQTQVQWGLLSIKASGISYESRKVEISGDCAVALEALRAVSLEDVVHLTVKCPSFENSHSWQEVITHVGAHGSALNSVTFKSKDGRGLIPEVLARGGIFSLNNLESLSVDLDCRTPPRTSQQAEEVFRSLLLSSAEKATPLQSLSLHMYGSGFPLSLRALQDVSTITPTLTSLALTVDSALPFDSFPTTPLYHVDLGQSTSALETMNLWEARQRVFEPQDYRKISLFLDHTFPSLRSGSITPGPRYAATAGVAELTEGWAAICDFRRDYQASREHHASISSSTV